MFRIFILMINKIIQINQYVSNTPTVRNHDKTTTSVTKFYQFLNRSVITRPPMTGTVEDKPILSGWVVEATAQSLDFISEEASAFEVVLHILYIMGIPGKGKMNTMITENAPEVIRVSRAADIDRFVGARIRERRVMLPEQQQMAELIGDYQQTHKYERGINRISAGRLFGIARVLKVPVGYFYEGLEDEEMNRVVRQRLCLELSRNFAQIETASSGSLEPNGPGIGRR